MGYNEKNKKCSLTTRNVNAIVFGIHQHCDKKTQFCTIKPPLGILQKKNLDTRTITGLQNTTHSKLEN